MDELRQEIYREDHPIFRSIVLSLSSNGVVKIDAHDMGKVVEDTWGDSDYEFWVNVPSSENQKLLFALLKDKFQGRAGAVDEFKEFCTNHRIQYKWDSWI